MNDCHLRRHDEAARNPYFPSQKVRDDDELPVSGTERMEDPVGEGDGETEEKGAEVIPILDCIHVGCDLGVGAALKFNQEIRQAGDPSGFVVRKFDRRRHRGGGVLRVRGGQP